jgi:hypothetical protein
MTASRSPDDAISRPESAIVELAEGGRCGLTTSEILDAAFEPEVVANEDTWWEFIWPVVQRIETSLRAGATADPADERELLKLIACKQLLET